ncbi:MAG: anti-sigma factor domain-containing protein, partial [Planctomycetota bacterium]
MRRGLRYPALAVALAFLIGCGGGNNDASTVTMTLSFDGLENVGPDFVYESWLIVDGAPVSAGRFSVNGGGVPSDTTFEVDRDDADRATAYVLTIEPAIGDDPAPSDVHLLGGDFSGVAAARLTVGHAAALGTDFATAGGSYILETPTSAAADDYFRGVWFLDPTAGPGPSLDLPALPAGWIYEGWSVVNGVPHSTGKFVSAAGDDSDLGGASAGPMPAPPFPGQDFVAGTVLDLRGGATVISVEPVPDTSDAPFTLKPLVDGTVEDLGAGVSQLLANQAAINNPTGTVSLGGAAVPDRTTNILELDLTGLGDLGPDFAYEGWLVGPGGPVSTGVFTIDETGRASYAAFLVDAALAGTATDFVLSIEPVPDLDPLPADTKVLGGMFQASTATLGIGHGAALGDDFGTAVGSYILAAPSTPPVGSADDDFFMGIWFLDPGGGPSASLVLPSLPNGWRYEGWVVVGGQPFTTGRFDMPAGADDDGAGA